MGRLAQLAVHVDVVGRPAGLELRVPDIAGALDRHELHVEDAD